jgi:dihydroorotate dehydrogenase
MLSQVYQFVLRPLLFRMDAEAAHKLAIAFCQRVSESAQLQSLVSAACSYQHPSLRQSLWGMEFNNPLGLAAGFDKEAIAPYAWCSFGFGFAEVGSITAQAQPGNPLPRLFRLERDRAILNRMGFNNRGAAATAAALTKLGSPAYKIPLGINLGKSKITPLDQAAADYCQSFRLLQPFADYFVINVSSPNTPGLRDLQAIAHLTEILIAIQSENTRDLPILVKVAPDLDNQDLQAIAQLAMSLKLAGIIATNTTISRANLKTVALANHQSPQTEAGGISGKPLAVRSTESIALLWQVTQGQLPIVGVGGIFTAEDAWAKITAGASLLQIYTGWVYESPLVIKKILAGLVQKLQQHGFEQINQAIGSQNHKFIPQSLTNV